jgi:hypothetical protein
MSSVVHTDGPGTPTPGRPGAICRYSVVTGTLWLGSPGSVLRLLPARLPTCVRQTFAERLPTLASVHAQRTVRSTEAVRVLGGEAGGEAGARMATRLGVPLSGDTVLRILRRTLAPSHSAPPRESKHRARVCGVCEHAGSHSYTVRERKGGAVTCPAVPRACWQSVDSVLTCRQRARGTVQWSAPSCLPHRFVSQRFPTRRQVLLALA